jgi:predicted secreted protein
MNRFLAAALAALILASPAAAERETLLRLSETAERLVRADELVALVQAQAMGGSAASVQEQLNRKVAGALARARAVPGVTVATEGYAIRRVGDRRDQWQAGQTLRLTAIEAAPALIELVGALQAEGLGVVQLSYEVSRPVERREREAVTAEALAALKERAERLGAVLGMTFSGFREVRVDSGRFARPPAPAPMMATTAEPARTPPSAEPADVPIAATVEGDAILKPR